MAKKDIGRITNNDFDELVSSLKSFKAECINIAVMANDIQYIKSEVKEIKTKLSSNYVTKYEFEPIKKIVYGMVGLILVAVIAALLKLVVFS